VSRLVAVGASARSTVIASPTAAVRAGADIGLPLAGRPPASDADWSSADVPGGRRPVFCIL